MLTIQQILWSAMIGLTLAAVYTFYTKRILGAFVHKLLERDAFEPETAVALNDLSLKGLPFIKFSLREGTDFSKTVLCVDGKYYIPENKIDKAERKYCGENISIIVFVLMLTLLFFTALVCSYLFPELLAMLGISI